MDIALTPELEELVRQKVASGTYHSASEVISDGLRLLQEQDRIHEHRLQELRKRVHAGLRQIERGEFTEYSSPEALAADMKEEMQRRYREVKDS